MDLVTFELGLAGSAVHAKCPGQQTPLHFLLLHMTRIRIQENRTYGFLGFALLTGYDQICRQKLELTTWGK